MAPSDIIPIRFFAESTPPPQPMVLSVWATDIHRPEIPLPSAHRHVPKFVNNASAPRTAKPAQTSLKVDILPSSLLAVPSVTDMAPPTIDADAAPATTGTAGPSQNDHVEMTPIPDSPLTELDSDDSDSDSSSRSVSDPMKIARPSDASCIPLPKLFPDWGSKKMTKVQKHIKKLTITHLNPIGKFKDQLKQKLVKFYEEMNGEFPFLKQYAKNWATIRLLQAHLKTRRTSHKYALAQATIKAVDSVLNPPPTTRARPIRTHSQHAIM
ncbi:hypothetical protein MVEN_00914600 [Mycena venus]|uniref:Uncharacterized protein n=1 Tax=Mycena venus TaxID=2733690 RepID=A0A8H6Y7S8_9AGAR|nr:hypothetical protein MVEN_00914600 [Mycena venus]